MTPERWQVIKKVLADALERKFEERRVYLDQACADPELRREVESLIAAHEQGDASFMGRSAAVSPDVLQRGAKLGPYEILGLLGTGGMGVVYKAEDLRLRRFVALKFLPEDVAGNSQALARFQREARAASALNHPNICTIYDIGETNGRAYIVMEYLEGKTLAQLIRERRLTTDEILDLGTEITNALIAAHAKGVIHRDIKPANIFITEEGQAKILDFGLAKVADTRAAQPADMMAPTVDMAEPDLTGPGAAVGTLAYMSPEQIRGEKLDTRTDIFSFGAVLYEMATGNVAFPGATPGIVFDAILNRSPVSAVRARPDLPPRFQEIVSKAIEKDRNVRYQHVSEVCADLKRLKRDTEPSQQPSSEGSSQKKNGRAARPVGAAISGWMTRRYAVIGAGLLLLLFFGVGLYRHATVFQSKGTHATVLQQRNLVVLPFTAVDGQQSEQIYCDGLTETVTAKLAQVNTLLVPSALEVRAKRIANIQDARKQFGANLVLVASWQQLQNSARINLSLIDAKTGHQLQTQTITAPATDLFRLQDEVVLEASRMLELQLSPTNAAALTNHGTTVSAAYDFYIQGIGYLQRYERPENVEIAIKLLQGSTKEDPTYAQARAALAQAYWDKYVATKESQWAEMAKSSVLEAQNLNSQLPEVQLAIGNLNRHTGDYLNAVSAFQRTLDLDPENVDAYIGLGGAYDSLGRTAEAEQAFRHAVAINPACWNCYNSLGIFLNAQARYGEAVQAWKRVTELTPDNVWGYMNVGAAYFNLGQFAESNEYFHRGLQLAPDDADLYSNAGTVSFFQGRFQEAAQYFLKAIELSPEKYQYWGNLADAYRMIPAESGKAARNYRQAIHLAESQLEVNPTDADVLSALARYYARTNDRRRAQEYLEEALKAKPEDVSVLLDACLVHIEGGDRQQAMSWLEKAVKAGYPREQLVANPELASLHSDPQFDRLASEAKSYR